MSFLAPWALLLGAAIGVPLFLHLWHRRTGTRFEFPAVRYLQRAQREHSREVKLRNLLLMLLRVGIVAALALAAARPIGGLPGVGHPPTALAIVLDNSRSSAAAGSEGPMLDRLVRAAREVVEGAAAGDALWLVTMDGAVTGGSRASVAEALARVQALDGAGDAGLALRAAVSLVRASDIPVRRVALLTDGQASGWDAQAGAALGDLPVVVHQPSGVAIPGRGITDVSVEPAHFGPRGSVRATVVGPDSTTWRVLVDGRTLARGSVRAGAGIVAAVQPSARGWLAGTVELAPDEFRADDVRHFAVHVGEPPAVIADPNSGPFLRGAVEALVNAKRARRADAASASTGAVRLTSAERAARPALIFAPSEPVRLAEAERAPPRAGIPWRFGARREGPAPLRGTGVEGALARQWYPLVHTGGAAAVDTIAFVGGAPWAVAGEGYVLVASPADVEATDLPLRAAFVPWIDALLAQRLAQEVGAVTPSAPGRRLRVPAGVDALERADGSLVTVRAGEEFQVSWSAGTSFWRRGQARVGALVVNGEATESELHSLPADSLARLLSPSARVAGDARALAHEAFRAGGARRLDGSLLVLALLLLVAESFVARRGVPPTTASTPARG